MNRDAGRKKKRKEKASPSWPSLTLASPLSLGPPPPLTLFSFPFFLFRRPQKNTIASRRSAPSVTRAVVERPAISASSSASIASRSPSSSVLAVILGGGAGTRLYPLTKQRAKPAVPIGGAYRLIDVPMSNCINSGEREINNRCLLKERVEKERDGENRLFSSNEAKKKLTSLFLLLSFLSFILSPPPSPKTSHRHQQDLRHDPVQLYVPEPTPRPDLQRGVRRPLRRRRLRRGARGDADADGQGVVPGHRRRGQAVRVAVLGHQGALERGRERGREGERERGREGERGRERGRERECEREGERERERECARARERER